MRILALDSATPLCAACVVEDGAVVAMHHESMERGQDGRLVPLVLEVMAKAGCDYAALDRIVAPSGPGSFTGIRVALSAARGLGLASGKPVFGVDRFRIFREQQASCSGPLLIVVESRRAELFAQFYPGLDVRPSEPFMATERDIAERMKDHADVTIAGDAADKLKPFLPHARVSGLSEPEVVTAARLIMGIDIGDPRFLPRPVYIRLPDVTLPRQDSACA